MQDICIMKKLVSQFIDTYMGQENYFPLNTKTAADAVDYFRTLVDEDYRPFEHDEEQPPIDSTATPLDPPTTPMVIERALVCRLIDKYRKQQGLVGPLTNRHLVEVWGHFIVMLKSFEVGAMYNENTWRTIDVESDELYAWYARTLAGRFVDARLDEHVECDVALTEAHLRDLLGDFQDLVWNGYGDDAIQVD